MATRQVQEVDVEDQIKTVLFTKIKECVENQSLSTNAIKKVSINIAALDLVQWLKNQINQTQFFYEDHSNSTQFACLGSIKTYQTDTLDDSSLESLIQDINTHPDLCYVTTIPCLDDNKEDEIWGNQKKSFYVPFIQIEQKESLTKLHCYIDVDANKSNSFQTLYSSINDLSFSEINSNINHELSKVVKETSLPTVEDWTEKVEAVKDGIRKGAVEKVVLSRRVDIKSNASVDVYGGLSMLRKNRKSGFTFMRKINEDSVFLGSTPELLYSRFNNEIKSMALAGTLKKALSNSDQLLNDPKEVQEHGFVKNWVESQLKSICSSVQVDPDNKVINHDYVQHIYSEVIGTLSSCIPDLSIIKLLHPTPAIGGMPTQEAKKFIKKLEPFSRGYFAGIVGLMSKESSQFAVTIRSALIKGSTVHLFSGAGIVKESAPNKEWDELNLKVQFLRDLLFV
jgi:menaquinone-specific isochorismate synthase